MFGEMYIQLYNFISVILSETIIDTIIIFIRTAALQCQKMAIHIQSGKNNLDCNLKNSKIQSVPFNIHADCDAPISKYFEPYVKTTENGLLTGSFRGYPLKGKTVDVPEGYVGVVLHESIKPTRDKDERKFYLVNKFREIVFWNWDKVPSKNDGFLKALDWIDIAEVLHSPIVEE